MEDSVRQMIGACFIALAEAAGPGVSEHANQTLEDAVKSGAVSDPIAQRAILILTRSCRAQAVAAELSIIATAIGDVTGDKTISQLAASIREGTAALSSASPAYVRNLIQSLDVLEEAISRRQSADAVA